MFAILQTFLGRRCACLSLISFIFTHILERLFCSMPVNIFNNWAIIGYISVISFPPYPSDTVKHHTRVLYTGLFSESSFSKSGGVHTSYTFPVSDKLGFTTGIAKDKVPKLCLYNILLPQLDSNPGPPGRQSNALTHSTTTPWNGRLLSVLNNLNSSHRFISPGRFSRISFGGLGRTVKPLTVNTPD